MTNFEKYKDILLKLKSEGRGIALYENKPIACVTINCAACEWREDTGIGCEYSLFKWLYEECTEPQVDWSKVKVDTPILVREGIGCEWMRRYFAKYEHENGKVYTWNDGRTSWNAKYAISWEYAKLLGEANND